MKQTAVLIVKCMAFLLILIILLSMINAILLPKYTFTNTTWPSTGTFRNFYKMRKDSIDVLILGSSVAVNNFIPQQLYNDYGIRSYALACEQQNVILSYYWLKEALRFQTPKLVIFEPLFLQNVFNLPLNSAEGMMRKALDPMHWSSVKREAINDICKLDRSQSVISYYLTNIRFHERWKTLTKNDFIFDERLYPRLYGWAPGGDSLYKAESFIESDQNTTYQFKENMLVYFDRMISLCKEKGITFIMIKVPQGGGNIASIDYAYRQLAQKYDIDYYNLLEKSIFDKMDVDQSTDSILSHGNFQGNLKNNAMIGKIISQKYDIPSVKDDQYEVTRDIYKQICDDYAITQIEDIDEYLQFINRPGYAVMISAYDDAVSGLKDSTKDLLWKLGTTVSWDKNEMFRRAYTAIIQNGKTVDKVSLSTGGKPLTINGILKITNDTYSIVSAGYEDEGGSKSTISINGKNYSIGSRGLNVVVYDLYLQRVVDSVCFDTFSDSAIIRKQNP